MFAMTANKSAVKINTPRNRKDPTERQYSCTVMHTVIIIYMHFNFLTFLAHAISKKRKTITTS